MPLRPPALDRAEHVLLAERRSLTRTEAGAVAELPLDRLPDLVALAHRVRLAYCGPEVELESLVNAKSGACPEDCAFCSQSARFHTDVDVYAFLDLDAVLEAAHATRAAGATQFCIIVAVRGPEERLLRKAIEAVGAVRRETGLEVACSLGPLDAGPLGTGSEEPSPSGSEPRGVEGTARQEELNPFPSGEIRSHSVHGVVSLGVQRQHLERLAEIAVIQLVVANPVKPHRALRRHEKVQSTADGAAVTKRAAEPAGGDSFAAAVGLGHETARLMRLEMQEIDDLSGGQ